MNPNPNGPPVLYQEDDIVFVKNGVGRVVALQIDRRRTETFEYDFVAQGAIANPLTAGAVQMAAISAPPSGSYADNVLFPIANLKGVTNVLAQVQNKQLVQAFAGVAPSGLRVGIKQPINRPTAEIDQNIALLGGTTLIQDIYNFDGDESPFRTPTQRSQVVILKGTEPSVTLLNPLTAAPTTGGWNPRFNMIINRCRVEAIKDAKVVKHLWEHLPRADQVHSVTVGGVLSGEVSYDDSAYDVKEFDPRWFAKGDWATKMTEVGYA